MRRLFTFVVLCLTLGVFITPVKAEEKANTNEWITVLGEEKKQLFELEIKNTGYQLLEYDTNDLDWNTYIKLYDENMNMLANTSFKTGKSGRSDGVFYSYYDKGTKLYIYQ